jgi:hypothetical protein
MTTESRLDSINFWSSERGLNFTVESLEAPPPLLFTGDDVPGTCLSVHEPEPTDQAPAQLGIWIPASGEAGSYCMMREGDDEISTFRLPAFFDDKALAARLSSLLFEFRRDFVFAPVLEDCLAEKGISYTIISPMEFGGDAGAQGDCTEWFFVEFKSQPPEEYDITLGVSGDGQGATFTADENGFLDFDKRVRGLKNASDFTRWVAEVTE